MIIAHSEIFKVNDHGFFLIYLLCSYLTICRPTIYIMTQVSYLLAGRF